MAILDNDLLQGTVYHPTKFQADMWNPYDNLLESEQNSNRRSRQTDAISVCAKGGRW